MKKSRIAMLLILLALAAACGTKGDLVLPPAETEKTPAPAAP
jgi:predicted small lipoprotein YifL